jgi:N-acetylglucosaminyldiphosphoundecaprenol N-acetyl-beta-D-mannosaminyltransferase
MTKAKQYEILGVSVDALTLAQAATQIVDRAAEPGACYVTKPYVEFLDRAAIDPKLRRLLNDGCLCLPDGVSLQWAAQYLYGGPPGIMRAFGLAAAIVVRPAIIRQLIPEKFGGATFTWELLEHCAAADRSVYLVGSPQSGDIAHTAYFISHRLPSLRIAGTWPGKLAGKGGRALERALENEAVEQDLAADLRAKRPDIVLVGMGFPLQEKLMAKLTPQLDHGVLVGEGGTFDYDSFGGRRRRAPGWLRRIGLEWLWRLLLEPHRWRRQLAIPRFMWTVYRRGK